MSLVIHNCEQGSPEWFEARRGIPTASEFAAVIAKSGKGPGGVSQTRLTYMRKLAGEVLTGESMEAYSNAHMERGKVMEAEARRLYAFMTDAEPELVGFMRNGNKGCSPDTLVGASGMSQIKTKLPHLQIELLEGEKLLPAEHRAQVQGEIWVAEREWSDFVSYWPKLPLFIVRVYRDETYIKEMSAAIDRFNEELAALVERMRNYNQLSEAA